MALASGQWASSRAPNWLVAAVVAARWSSRAVTGLQYPFGGVPFTTLGISYQQALRNYLTGPLGGVVTAASTRLARRAHHHRVTQTVNRLRGLFRCAARPSGSNRRTTLSDGPEAAN
jgi:hypothetical protein